MYHRPQVQSTYVLIPQAHVENELRSKPAEYPATSIFLEPVSPTSRGHGPSPTEAFVVSEVILERLHSAFSVA
jgi:hypothetical protein